MGFLSLADHKRESSGRYTPKQGDTPGDKETHEITWAELPLNCPLPHMRLWDAHPQIYPPIHKTGREQCPYCGTVYTLAPPTPGERAPFFRGDIEIERYYYIALEAVENESRQQAGAPALTMETATTEQA